MNANAKTLTFLAVAAAAVLLAVFTRPSSLPLAGPDDFRGQPLYPKFTDPMAVASLEIVEFDEDTATVRTFLVAEVDVKEKTRWVIPSHDNYSADAKDQVASSAAGLMGLKIIEMTGDQRGDQRTYGVIAPDSLVLRVGDTGVGEQVVMRDENGKELLALVIGKEVPDSPGLRYVRKVGEDQIFVVKLDTSKLSTKFDDWIERNLLGIETWDIKRLWIRNYSVDELNAELNQRGDIRIAYDDAGEPRWKLIEDRKFEAGKWVPVELADDEELNAAKLDEMKYALDDLKIVDVSRKPAGLSADLKAAADFANQREAVESLARKGFFAAKLGDRVELFSNEGEVRVTMKDGVEYVLRFGEIAAAGAAKKDEKPKEGDKEGEDEKQPGSGVNRYLFVMAEFNADIIPKPQFEPLPEIKKEGEKKPAEENKDAQPKPDEKAAEEKKPDEKKAEEEKTGKNQPEKSAEKTEADLKAERERIEKTNKRKQDEYDRLLSDGKRRVAELNARFADWYYIISDEVYRKIHLTRDELIKKKEKPAEGKQGKDDQAGEKKEPALPAEVLEKLKAQGPAGKK